MKNKRKTKTKKHKLTLSNAEIDLPGITPEDSEKIIEAIEVLVHYGVRVCHTIKEDQKKQTRKKKTETKNGNRNSKSIRRSPSREGSTANRRESLGSNAARSARAPGQARNAKPTEPVA